MSAWRTRFDVQEKTIKKKKQAAHRKKQTTAATAVPRPSCRQTCCRIAVEPPATSFVAERGGRVGPAASHPVEGTVHLPHMAWYAPA